MTRVFPFLLSLVVASTAHGLRGSSVKVANGPEFSASVGIPNCSAIFITSRDLLTAAHCVDNFRKEKYLKINAIARFSAFEIEIDSINIHKTFYAGELTELSKEEKKLTPDEQDKLIFKRAHGDLALVKLKTDVANPEILAGISKLKLDDAEPYLGRENWVVGMGLTKVEPKLGRVVDIMPELKKLALPVKDLEKHEGFLTFRYTKDGGMACHGDSGASLINIDGTNTKLLGVVVIISNYCGKDGALTYIEPVGPYLSWITGATSLNAKTKWQNQDRIPALKH